MSFSSLGERVREEQDQKRETGAATAYVRMRLAAAPARRSRWRSRWTTAAGMLAVAAMTALLLRPPHPVQPLSFDVSGTGVTLGAWIPAAPSGITAVHFSDGSLFALRDGARARVESVTPDGARIVIERGNLSADVVHTETSEWAVFAGPYEVQVTGTQFDVAWDPTKERLEVHVARGSVLVNGGPESHALGTNDTLVFAPEEQTPTEPEPLTVTSDEPREAPQPTAPQANPLRWKQLAVAGKYSDAVDIVKKNGVNREIETIGPADLFVLADAARLSQNPDIAEQTLVALRRRYPNDVRAPRAAFDLGRLEFDQRADYASAARWFETCLREDPNGPLDREAAGRLIEARKKAGNEAGTRAAAQDYLDRYPGGPHAYLARSVLSSK